MATKISLSDPRRRLLELMQEVNFGRIENLLIINAEPVLEPAPRIVHEVKFSGENNPRPERKAPDFDLKNDVVELFKWFDRIGTGTIALLKIKHGLPFQMEDDMEVSSI